MASRTKSFFEQDSRQKSNSGQWKGQHSHRAPNNSALSEIDINAASARPPIPPTTQAKSKLKAFAFIEGRPTERDSNKVDKENVASAGAEETSKQPPSPSQKAATSSAPDTMEDLPSRRSPARSKEPALPHANTFPCTPGMRLPLVDLIGNLDSHITRPEAVEQSPEDQITWMPHSSSEFLTPNRRKRKRARSSSPSCPNTSSQRQTASSYFPGAIATYAQNKTPDADPAADLWQRYAGGKASGSGLKLPDFRELNFQASPRPLQTPVKSGGLRRWASTGNDWPSSKSKNKRQRRETKMNLNVWQDQQPAPVSGKSKLAVMVEKIQESLASQKLARSAIASPASNEAPLSSNPTLDTTAAIAEKPTILTPTVAAPTIRAVNTDAVQAARPPTAPHASSQASRVQGEIHLGQTERPFVDPLVHAPLKLQSKAPLPAFKRPSMQRKSSGGGRVYPTAQVVAPVSEVLHTSNELDEFGDDFDMTAEDLDELVSQPAMQQRSLYDIPPHPDPPPDAVIVIDDSTLPTPAVIEQVLVSNEFGLSDDDDDEFGCGDIDEDSFAQAEVSATQAYLMPPLRSPKESRSSCKPTLPSSSSTQSNAHMSQHMVQRFVVKQVVDGEYTNAKGRRCTEKVLMVEDERTARPMAIVLRDSWVHTTVAPTNILHSARFRTLDQGLAAASSLPGQLIVSDDKSSPLLVVHPDHMLSATTVADSFDCLRKAVLQDRIKATGDTSKSMIYGKILHEIFQQALAANRWDDQFLSELVDHTVQTHAEGLWELGMKDTVLALEEVKAKMTEVAAWARVFVGGEPSAEAVVDDKQGSKVWMSVSKLIAIEEHIWSPRYGLKGNIDATIESTLMDNPSQPSRRFIAPFEVKTGRTTQSAAHTAQTALYTLLLSDRYDLAVEAGILYYLESSSMSRIAPPMNEVRQMIQQRNRLASYLHRARMGSKTEPSIDTGSTEPQHTSQEIEESGLPALLKNPFKCGKCYAQQSCFAYHALAENGTTESAGMIDDAKKNHTLVWQEAVGHLALQSSDALHAARLRRWFAKWDKLLTLEESDQSRYRKELWTMSSAEREASGRCFGNLVLKRDATAALSSIGSTQVDGIEGGAGRINRFAYVFERSAGKAGGSFAEGSQLTVGEPVVISSETGQWALANGYVTATSKRCITVAVDRKLSGARERLPSFDEHRNQVFRGTMSHVDEPHRSSAAGDQILYRLDKDEFSNGLALIRNNLVTLMSPHPIHTKLRSLIIESLPPKFGDSSRAELPRTQLGKMNDDQRNAVDKILSAQDYALILGMPGTGKTTTIAHIIRALLAENKSILLTSFTHTAVDNILLKIRDIAPPNSILRLGVPAKIDQEVQTFCRLANTPRKTIDEIEEVYMGCQIVATTCMGTNHAIFRRRAFDVCIVDEASQITLPTSLGPLLHARKFVLVGDHYQLPPLVQNRAALEGGFDVSLFRQLSEEHPEAVTMLGEQYRMCEDIMMLSNELIYDGKLRCGSDAVATRTLCLTNEAGLQLYHNAEARASGQCSTMKLEREQCWLADLTRPTRKVVFANTDPCGPLALETLTSGNRITNALEATLTAQIVLSLLALGVPSHEIGVITFYRSQLLLIRQVFNAARIPSEVDIDSADRFQGRDKECIILSMVRANENGMVGELLKDWRRINVALTRAKSKLIVLGHRQTLRKDNLLEKFMDLVDRQSWAIDLPKAADELHTFNFISQATATPSALTPAKSKSPLKARSRPEKHSPAKSTNQSLLANARGVLTESRSIGNRGSKVPGKVIKGSKTISRSGGSAKHMKEQIAMDIWEDLTGEEF